MTRKRFIVEAEWTGYQSSQQRIVHRTVETHFRAGFEALEYHQFSDGTGLRISVRDCKPRERVKEIRGYKVLLDELAWKKWKELRDVEVENLF
jgi:hypothetical protein